MIINKGTKVIKKGTVTSIVDIVCDDYVIHVFPGGLSPWDILLKYKSPTGGKIRTPKHVHWAVDLLLKKQKKPLLTDTFLKKLSAIWDTCGILEGHDIDDIKGIFTGIDSNCASFKPLDSYGEYPVDFLFPLMVLLMVQEKTNATHKGKTAHMFKDTIDELLKDELDIFKVISTAGFGGRK